MYTFESDLENPTTNTTRRISMWYKIEKEKSHEYKYNI